MKKYIELFQKMKASILVSFVLTVVLLFVQQNLASAAVYTSNVIPVMTSATTPAGVVTASEQYPSTMAWKAFDGYGDYYNGGNYAAWATTKTTGWLAYEFPTPKTISKYVISYNTAASSVNPKNWTFEGSNDGGTTWIILDTKTNITNWQNPKNEFTVNNNTAYKKYRVNITANSGSTSNTINLAITELEMMEQINPTVAAPTNLTATGGNAQIGLTWTAVTGATGYNIKRATTVGGSYTEIATSVTEATYTDTNVTNGTTYYYVVTAVDANGESGNSNEASATPQEPVQNGNRALLVVTMSNGADQDYDLSMAEVNSFINWYNSKATGVGQPYYCLTKTPLAPYLSRTDYLIFDKIVCFKVNEY